MPPLISRFVGAALLAAIVAVPAHAECFPQCRAGYACEAGKCVESVPVAKACFPACRSGFSCESGVCKATATAPTKTPSAAPGTPPLVAPPSIDPSAPAPQPIDPEANKRRLEEEQQHQAVRTDLKFGLIVAAGYSWNTLLASSQLLNPEGSTKPMAIGGPGPGLTLGLGLRKNVVSLFGVQAGVRVHGYYFDDDPSHSLSVAGEPHNWTHSGFGIRFSGDVSVRVGPFADAFPMFLGLGGIVAMDVIFGTLGFDGITKTPDVDYSEVHLRGGIVGELGFVFGGSEEFELGLRAEFMTSDTNDDSEGLFDSIGFHLSFGWSWL